MLNLKNTDKKNKSFMYQNLQKSKCFNCNFSSGNFNYACFRGAHMKACNFNSATFVGAEFIGANLKESQFKNAVFENVVFEGSKLELVDFKGAVFKNVIFVDTNLEQVKNLDLEDTNISVFDEMPALEVGPELIQAVEQLMQNDFVKRSRVLDTKDKKMNTISVLRLLDQFEESVLVERLNKVVPLLDRDFYTLSYLIKLIAKIGE